MFTGHEHNYQRFYPLNGGSRDDIDGVTYIVSAGGGASLYGVDKNNCEYGNELANYADVHHIVKISVKDNVLCGQTVNLDNEVIDEFSVPFGQLSQCQSGTSPPQTHYVCQGNQCVEIAGVGNDECSSDSDCYSPPGSLEFEAEAMTLTSPMAVYSDSSASGREYIQTPNWGEGQARYTFNISESHGPV